MIVNSESLVWFVLLFEKADLMNLVAVFGVSLSYGCGIGRRAGRHQPKMSRSPINLKNFEITFILLDPGIEAPLFPQLMPSDYPLSPEVRRLPLNQLSISNIYLGCKPSFFLYSYFQQISSVS